MALLIEEKRERDRDMDDIQQSLNLLDKIFLRARENAARAVGEDVLAGAEVFLSWTGSSWHIEVIPSRRIAEKFNIWLEKKEGEGEGEGGKTFSARAVGGDFCHEFARWCPPIDRGMLPSQLDAQSYPQSVVWLGPLVSFDDASKTRAAREIFKKPKAAELLLLGFTSTQLQVIDNAVHTEAMTATFPKIMEFNDKLAALRENVKERMKAGNLSKAEAASLKASMNSLMKERAEANKEAHDAGRALVPVVPFSAKSLEELEMKFDLFFFPKI